MCARTVTRLTHGSDVRRLCADGAKCRIFVAGFTGLRVRCIFSLTSLDDARRIGYIETAREIRLQPGRATLWAVNARTWDGPPEDPNAQRHSRSFSPEQE